MNHLCALCGSTIEHYHEDLNCLKLDETRSVDICSECIHKFLEWQQKKYATLFPTRRAKQYLKKRKSE